MTQRQCPQLTLLEEAKIQAKVLVPVLKAFRAELGEQRANQIARDALYSWWLALAQSNIEPHADPMQKLNMAFAAGSYAPESAQEIDIAPIRRDALVNEFHVTGCRYADFFREIGEPELGFMLLCNADHAFTEAAGDEIELIRPQTIMQGGSYCDFMWRLNGQP